MPRPPPPPPPPGCRLGDLAPDMVRLDAETEQITHAIRLAEYNAESPSPAPWTGTTPARP